MLPHRLLARPTGIDETETRKARVVPTSYPDELTPGQAIFELRNVTFPDGTTGSVAIDDGSVGNAVGAPVGASVDAAGWLLLPPAADLHAHIDKAYTWHAAGEPEIGRASGRARVGLDG